MCSFSESEENVFKFKDEQPVSDPVHEYTDTLRNDKAAIIIDNGMCVSTTTQKLNTHVHFQNQMHLYILNIIGLCFKM